MLRHDCQTGHLGERLHDVIMALLAFAEEGQRKLTSMKRRWSRVCLSFRNTTVEVVYICVGPSD